MSREFVLVDPEQFDRLQETLEELGSILDEIRDNTGSLNIPDSGQPSLFEKEAPEPEEPLYVISRTSKYSYADVVDREIEDEEFSLDDAWRRVKPLIESEAKRPRDSFRQSLDNDERFERVEDRPGTWFRRREVNTPTKAGDRRGFGIQGFKPETLDHTDEEELPRGYRLENPSLGWYRPIGPHGEPLTNKNKRKDAAVEVCREDARKKGRLTA